MQSISCRSVLSENGLLFIHDDVHIETEDNHFNTWIAVFGDIQVSGLVSVNRVPTSSVFSNSPGESHVASATLHGRAWMGVDWKFKKQNQDGSFTTKALQSPDLVKKPCFACEKVDDLSKEIERQWQNQNDTYQFFF